MAKLLSILLQRSDPTYPWGFSVSGGRDQPLLIDQVTPLSLAAQYLAPGDTVLEIEKVDTRQLWPEQVGAFIGRPGRSLELLIQKGSGVVNPYPSNPRAYSRTAQSPTPRDQTTRSTYASSDSGAGSSTSSKRTLRDNFWERVSNELPDFGRERYNRLSNGSPFRDRQSRMDQWRRCQSEEKTNPQEEKFNSFFADKPSNFTSTIPSVWSPTPSDRLRSQTSQSSDYWSSQETKGSTGERQDDLKYWNDRLEKQQSESMSSRSGSLNRAYKRHNSDFTHDYSSYSSESASTPKSFASPEPRLDFMKKPSDFWNDQYRNLECKMRLGSLLSPPPLDSPFKNSNISSKSEFKKSVSFKEQSYSSAEGAKSFETFEHVNKTKETEKTAKLKENGKEEVVEKTKKNKEYVLANKDDVNGQPKETKKVISDFKIIEKIMDGEQEFCNKVKEHSEEVTNSNTPVNFYDNVQQHDESQQKAQLSDQKKVVHNYESATKENIGAHSGSFSPLLDRPFGQKRQMSSTPVSEVGDPIQESFFEVDIRTPLESQSWNTFTSTEEFLSFR